MGRLARRGGDLEAFTAFLGGLLAAGLTGLALVGVNELVAPAPWLRRAAPPGLVTVWLTVTVGLYLRLRAAAAAAAGGRTGTGRPTCRVGPLPAAGYDRRPERRPLRRPGRKPGGPLSPRSPGLRRARRRGPAR